MTVWALLAARDVPRSAHPAYLAFISLVYDTIQLLSIDARMIELIRQGLSQIREYLGNKLRK
jgi:hypothetical protein